MSSREAPVYIVIRHRNRRATLATGFTIKPRDWNEKTGEVRKTYPDHAKVNRRLAELTAEAQAVVTDMIAEGKEPLPREVKRRMEERTATRRRSNACCFFSFSEEVIEAYRGRGQIATWKSYRSAVRKLRAYVKSADGRDTLLFEDLTPTLLRRFQVYLSEERKNKPNTVTKNVVILKTLFRQASQEGLVSYAMRPFDTVKLQREKAIKTKLSTEQVRIVAMLDLQEGSLLELVRDAWMFAFYAGGMRFGDVATMRREHLQVARREGREEIRSLYRMGKTEGIHGVLLVDRAVEILDRYSWRKKRPQELVFPFLDCYDLSTPEALHKAISARNALANKYLKKIQELASLPVSLTFHLSRHSIAGYLLEQGYDVYTIKEVLGHETVRITEDYLRGFKGRGPDEAMRSIQI